MHHSFTFHSRFFASFLVLVACLVLTTAPGCGGGEDASDGDSASGGGNGKQTPPITLKEVDGSSLPKTPNALPPLDGGRITLEYPDGWKPASRSSNFVASFYREGTSGNGPPRITVTVEEKTPTEITATTKDNVEEFRDQIQAWLDGQEKIKVLEPPRPMLIGGQPWIRHVRSAKWNKAVPIEMQVLQRAVDGRLYTIELQVEDGNIPKYRDDAYTMAAAAKFEAASDIPAPQVPEAGTPESDTPAGGDGGGENGN